MLLSREKSLEKLLYSADVLITEASSTCLEALACGIPVIMMENINAITYDPIPKNIPNKMYKKIRTQQQLIDAIQYYISQIELGKIQQKVEGLKIRKKYFEPITSKGIDRLINANTQIKT
jgi:CDP-glycerol glycerophosphotransferase (TagB/SpsB family)